MTDREMLELAARAGSCVVKGAVLPGGRSDGWWGLYLEKENDTGAFQEWNPRTDDGDALRLAVYLEFEIDITSTGVAVRTRCGLKVLVNKTEEPDLCAAARLAITRAAAEIGRQMEVTT